MIIIPHRRSKASGRESKRILTKDRIDRQLTGQSVSSPFMSIRHSYNKKVTFDTQDRLEERINRHTVMMSKLTTKEYRLNNQLKLKIFQGKKRINKKFLWQKKLGSEKVSKIGIDQIAET